MAASMAAGAGSVLQRRAAVPSPCHDAAGAGGRCGRAWSRLIMPQAAAVDAQAASSPAPRIKVVGMGSCGVDYLASVAAFPRPDEKLRTDMLEVQGGGNCANALTAAARLGLAPTIVTKIGGDGLGDGIISDLRADGVDTTHVLRAAGHPSPFTYIIVDRAGGTRTCIHTPGAAMVPEEMSHELLESVLAGAALVYMDGRLTEAALVLSRAARAKGIPVLVEAERLRPSLEALLAEADYVVTSAHFPQDWTGEAELADAILATSERLPRARFVVTTLGTRGSVMLERPPAGPDGAAAGSAGDDAAGSGGAQGRPLDDVMADLRQQLEQQQRQQAGVGVGAACVSGSGVAIGAGGVAQRAGYERLQYSSSRDASRAVGQATAAAQRAAALNADAGRASSYTGRPLGEGTGAGVATAERPPPPGVVARVSMASIANLPKEAVVDTTGAGDSFIGTVLYGLVTGMGRLETLRLAAVVAACKCTALGARPGLPRRSQLAAELL